MKSLLISLNEPPSSSYQYWGECMNREIKFRAWWVRDEVMENWETILEERQLSMYFRPDERTVIMQFTGLNDKNGKECFEGDIVKTSYHSYDDGEDYEGIYKVGFNDGGFILQDIKTGEFRSTVSHNTETHNEIIGNIYENPELLTPNPTNQ